jgi:hypothetical protein
MKRGIALSFAAMGLSNYFWPGTNGWFDRPIAMTAAEARIVLAILWVGAAILWYMPEPPKKE